jgi:hypothetical protein
MSNSDSEMIEEKVQRSLKRLGFDDCCIREFRDGRLLLSCPATTRNDQSLIKVAMRLIAGVTSVAFETTPSE